MPDVTTNFGLKKPTSEEFYDVNVQNENMDVIDAELKNVSDDSKAYTDQKFNSIPTPDVSGQINTHNDNSLAHPAIRSEIAASLTNAKAYTDQKFNSIPTPDVSGQINTHNTDTSAHSDIRTALNGKAPTAHAVNANTYGVGNSNVYGHVKISDKTDSTSGASAGVAASPAAVKAVYDLANTANTTANSKAPMYTYGTEDLEAGVTPLESGKLHFVYE